MGKFVGTLQDYTARTNPDPGGLYIVYRNGAYHRTATPGSVVRRVGGVAPWFGNVQLLPVRIDGVQIASTLVNLATSDSPARILPDAFIRASVIIDPKNDYAKFVAFAANNRLSFEDELIAAATAAVEDLLRAVVTGSTHDELTRSSFMTVLNEWLAVKPLPQSVVTVSGILEARFTPSRVVETTRTWDEQATLERLERERRLERELAEAKIRLERELAETEIRLKRELAEAKVQLELERTQVINLGVIDSIRINQDRARELDQIDHEAQTAELRSLGSIALAMKEADRWADLARLLGVPTHWLMYPERYEKQAAEANAALLALIHGDPTAVLRRNPEILTQLRADSTARLPQTNPRIVDGTRVADAVMIGESTSAGLVVDQKLANAWRGVFGDLPEGIVGYSRGDGATVIVVTDADASPDQIPYERFAKILQSAPISVQVIRPGTLESMTAHWFSLAETDASLTSTARIRDGVLEIRIRGPILQAKAAVDRLDDPSGTATTAFGALFIDADRVDVDLGDGSDA